MYTSSFKKLNKMEQNPTKSKNSQNITSNQTMLQASNLFSENTEMSNLLKEKFENKSRHIFDDVNVHYNSEKPKELNALAYTKGTDIFIGKGQEKHLQHELGHVMQQKQGIVKATETINGIPVNTNENLERNADNFDFANANDISVSNQSSDVVQMQLPLMEEDTYNNYDRLNRIIGFYNVAMDSNVLDYFQIYVAKKHIVEIMQMISEFKFQDIDELKNLKKEVIAEIVDMEYIENDDYSRYFESEKEFTENTTNKFFKISNYDTGQKLLEGIFEKRHATNPKNRKTITISNNPFTTFHPHGHLQSEEDSDKASVCVPADWKLFSFFRKSEKKFNFSDGANYVVHGSGKLYDCLLLALIQDFNNNDHNIHLEPVVILAHELMHGLHAVNGMKMSGTEKNTTEYAKSSDDAEISMEELATTMIENKISPTPPNPPITSLEHFVGKFAESSKAKAREILSINESALREDMGMAGLSSYFFKHEKENGTNNGNVGVISVEEKNALDAAKNISLWLKAIIVHSNIIPSNSLQGLLDSNPQSDLTSNLRSKILELLGICTDGLHVTDVVNEFLRSRGIIF